MLTTVATAKFFIEDFSRSRSLMPTASPMPMMGPISGETSMAPMITAVEFTFRPSEAMKMAKMSTQRLAPRNCAPARMPSMTSDSDSLSGIRLKYSWKKLLKLDIGSCCFFLIRGTHTPP